MRFTQRLATATVAVTAAISLAACDSIGGSDDAVRIMVPNSTGGGYDTTARTAAQIIEDEKILDDAEVYNLEGAGGTTGLAKLVANKGKDGELMLMGLGVVGAVYTNQSEKTLADTTPIARLISEADVVVVPADSKYRTLDDFVADWKDDTDIPVGGGSSPGGPDHLAAHLTADAVGITPKDVNYVVYDGGGPLLSGLYSGEVKAGFSGVGEYKEQIAQGKLRVLAVTSPERVPALPDAPTMMEEGVDLEFINWRGLVAPPGISDDERDRLVKVAEDLHETEAWEQAMDENGWTDAFLTGDDFGDYLEEQDETVAQLLADLGLV